MENDAVSRALSLVSVFHSRIASFGTLHEVGAEAVPQPYRRLLDHRSHMTATMERHHGGLVSLRVVAIEGPDSRPEGRRRYSREILLSAPSGRVVQYGIVRIDLTALSAHDAARVQEATVPLGRILITSGAHCDVEDVALLTVHPGKALVPFVGSEPTFGRVATIRIKDRLAIELLEIVVEPGGG